MRLILAALLLPLCPLLGADWRVNVFPPADRIVKNPSCGYAFMPRLETVDKFPDWLLDTASIAYFRIGWDEVVNEKGEYDFDRLDAQVFSGFRKRGLRLAMRIMAANRFSPKLCLFPRETRGKGIPFIPLNLMPGKIHEVPIFWSEAYIQEHGRLMQALGAWAEKHPELDHVDLGGMGEFGENHLSRWTEAQLSAAGYSEKIFIEALLRMMEQAERFLPGVPRALCVSPFDGLSESAFRLVTERAVRRGWWLRTDSLTDKGPTWTVASFFERFHWRTPWILEPSGGINRGFFGEPIALPRYFEAVARHQPHVVNLMGMWDLGKLKPEEQQFLAEQGRRIGYRLQVQKAVLPETVTLRAGEPPAVPFSVTFAQNGAVPYLGDAMYQLRFTQDGKTVFEQAWVPDEPPSTLLPGKKRGERFWVSLPKGFAAKPTGLSLAIRDLRAGYLRPDNGAVDDGFFVPLGRFSFQTAPAGKSAGDILTLLGGATAPAGMEIAKSAEGITLKGREEKGWSYANFPGPDLESGSIYVMKIGVRAWKSAVADSRLKFKIAVRKAGESGVRNYYTESYDFEQSGEWQELTLQYQPKEPETIFVFGVEKGRTAPSTLNAEFRSWTLEARALAPLE